MKNGKNDFYSVLKSKNDIIECANLLHFKGTSSGSYVQGDCPRHGSTKGKCLVIWPRIQAFKCYHCQETGDIIDLVMLFKRCDHRTAVKFLADRVGMPLYGGRQLTPQEIAQHEADILEEKLLSDMLTKAAGWYHEQLNKYQEIKDHLINHYKFSENIIEELQIGYAPAASSIPGINSELAAFLASFPEFQGKLAATSLFNFGKPNGPFYDYFKGRIIFPYWVGGKVVYFTGRETSLTPADEYECYKDKDGNIKLDENGNPSFIKYKKLRTYDPDHPTKKYLSRFIQNDSFMGEDSVRGQGDVIITEGAPDLISAVDHGFAAVSPVTTNFRKEDWGKLEVLTRYAKNIYVINDNEDNQAGYDGALNTGIYLTKKGRNVYLVILPKPAETPKIDLNDYLKVNTADDLRKLMASSKTVLQLLIDKLPGDFLQADPILRETIAPILIELDDIKQKYYVSIIRKKLKVEAKLISEILETVKRDKAAKAEQEKENEEIQIDPEIEKAASEIAKDPQLFLKRIDIINDSGVIGERKNISMFFCALESRLLPADVASPNALAIKCAGHYGAGKSYTIGKCLVIYPENAYHMITGGSAKSLYFLKDGLKHKCLIVTEGFNFQTNNAADSEFVYSIRSLISEGQVSYQLPQKGEDGNFITVEKKIAGPTSFITTTIMESLEEQLEDRLFTIHPDESIDQTKEIIVMTADQKAGKLLSLDEKVVKIWKAFHASLRPVSIIIPYAPKIAETITGDKNKGMPITTRRAFKRVLIVIQAVACAYQHQRERTENGEVMANIADYRMALQIVEQTFRESLGQKDARTEKWITFMQGKGKVRHKTFVDEFGASSGTVTNWIAQRVKDNTVIWCDENGFQFADDNTAKKAKRSGTAFVRISDIYAKQEITGLPSPYALTKDPAWNKEGELYRMYDLRLDKKGKSEAVQGCSSVLIGAHEGMNTVNDSEANDIVNDSSVDGGGAHVLSDIEEDKEKNEAVDEEDGREHQSDIDEDQFPSMDKFDKQLKSITSNITPGICRSGCIHYDPVNDVKSSKLIEYCCHNHGSVKINFTSNCKYYEKPKSLMPEGCIAF